MKKISILFLLAVTAILTSYAQSTRELCNLGITFEISNNPSWGYGQPVILSVQPFSPADRAGLKVDDIIMEVNGVATYLRNYPTINNWLTDTSSPLINLTVRNLNTYFQPVSITRDCKPSNAISEFDLASAYSFYSVESTNERSFSVPMLIDPNSSVDFSDYRTFSFVQSAAQPTNLDLSIKSEVERALLSRGLTRDDNDPDMLVQVSYSYQPNVKYNYSAESRGTRVWRYDVYSQSMVQVPILSAGEANAEVKGQYVLDLSIKFFDKKYIDDKSLTQIWSCSSKEYLTDNYSLEEYARIQAPLMLLEYPYSSAKSIAKFKVSFKKFNYTGLNFDADKTGLILSVDAGSPAYKQGLRAGDEIVKINGLSFKYTPYELQEGYKRFIVETMKYRDPSTKFISAGGFPDCMYWKKSMYPEIADAFRKSIYATSFSYLYAFEKYIALANILDVEYKREGKKYKIRVSPEVQSSIVVSAL